MAQTAVTDPRVVYEFQQTDLRNVLADIISFYRQTPHNYSRKVEDFIEEAKNFGILLLDGNCIAALNHLARKKILEKYPIRKYGSDPNTHLEIFEYAMIEKLFKKLHPR